MTNEEVIEILCEQRDNAQLPEYIKEATEITISAVKKCIPKKPELFRYYKCGMYYNDYYCPNDCDSYCQVFTSQKFCPKCGQALDWSGIE